MGWMTHPGAVSVRNKLRGLGIFGPIARTLWGSGYEKAFHAALIGAVRPEDQIWDVGANVGFYTALFAERAGEKGKVYAFEPSPKMFELLNDATVSLSNCVLIPKALGEQSGVAIFEQSGVTSRIISESRSDTIEVTVVSGDELVASGETPLPNVIKIDIEGFELEAVRGLSQVLSRPSLRFVGIEVHFGILNERGLNKAPAEIERRLNEAGLQTRWTDSSHIVAERF